MHAAFAGLTGDMAAFVSDAVDADLPEGVADQVAWALLDTIGVTVAGTATPAAEATNALARSFGGSPRAKLVGRTERTDPASAALVNGATGHALDFDDQSWVIGGHPSVVLLPGLLALAEDHGLSGSDVVRAYAVGYECAAQIGRLINPAHYGHGWHTTATIGSIGAACACANLLRLDVDRTADAIGIAASLAGGLRQSFGTDTKPLHAGNAARSGVMAASLAAAGLGGHPRILEGSWGFLAAFSGERGATGIDVADLVPLGARWAITDPGPTRKLFGSCGATHPGIGAALELRERGVRADTVERLEIRVVDMTARILEYPRPTTAAEAKFSMEYCVARAMVSGTVGLGHFEPPALAEPEVRDLVERTDMVVDERLTAEWEWATPRPVEITAHLRDGRREHQRTELPPGSPDAFSRDMLEAKFRDCVASSALVGSPEQIIDATAHLASLDEVTELTRLVAARDDHDRPRRPRMHTGDEA